MLTMNWQMFWWEDLDELLRCCDRFEGIFGYTGSLERFSRNEIAQVTVSLENYSHHPSHLRSQIICMNTATYIRTYGERAAMMVFVLNDGRYAYLCEGTVHALLCSRATINYKCILASSLQLLLFFGLGNYERECLGIDIDGMPSFPSTVSPFSHTHTHTHTHNIHLTCPSSVAREELNIPKDNEEGRRILEGF